MSLQKNQSIELEITGMTAQGSGVGRCRSEDPEEDGVVVFVPFTAVGDIITCHLVKVQKKQAYGRVAEIIKASPHRLNEEQREGDCAAFGRCGGCAFRHVTYEAELQYKWQKVADALQRNAGFSTTPQPIVPCENPDHYRNKAQYPVVQGEHRLLVGFYAPRSHRLIEERHCRLQPVIFGNILDCIVKWAKKTDLSVYDETTGQGLLRHLYIRQAEATGEIMVCFVCTSGKLPESRTLIDLLQAEVPGLSSVVINVNKEDTNVVLGDTCFTLWGNDTIVDELCGLRFRLSPPSFYQVNRRQAEKLYVLAAQAAALTGQETVLDLYCGTGTIGLSMAHSAAQIIGVEIVERAVQDARRNALDNQIENARFLCADAAGAVVQLHKEGVCPHVVILDPPRKGCTPEAIEAVVRMNPARVVYISCDPATLARDCALLAEQGYVLKQVTPVDLFPRTYHVECVCLLTRNK